MKKCRACGHPNGPRAKACSGCAATGEEAFGPAAELVRQSIADVNKVDGQIAAKPFRVSQYASGGLMMIWPDNTYLDLTPREAEVVREFCMGGGL